MEIENTADHRRGKNFQNFVSQNWNEEIPIISRTELQTRRWNFHQLIPLTEDLVKLKNHLTEIQPESIVIRS